MATARAQMDIGTRTWQTSDSTRDAQRARGHAAARALGWFSVGLGLTGMMASHSLGKAVGVRRPWTLRAVGLREFASGIGILLQPRQPAWLWGRVAGDAMDLALLGAAFAAPQARRGRLATAVGAVGLVTALDVVCSRQLSKVAHRRAAGPIQLSAAIAIDRPPEQLYRFWSELANLPRFMPHVREVRMLDAQRSHWVLAGPAGSSIEWDAELTEDRVGEMIAWRSLPGAALGVSGSVHFERAPNAEGALVRLQLSYQGPAGPAGATVAKFLGALPKQQVKVDLRRFKQLIETGEIATIDGQPSGRRSRLVKLVNKVVQP